MPKRTTALARGAGWRRRLARLGLWWGLVALASALGGCERRRTRFEPGVAVVLPTQAATWVRNFNPFLPTQARWPTPSGIYEPLLIYHTLEQRYVPWLATGYRWENENRALVMTIRQGVRFSDGTPMGPKDVVFTWRLMKQHPALDSTGMARRLASVDAAGDEVTFLFDEPFVPGLYFVAQAPIVPEHIWRSVSDPVAFANPHPVGTGPFTEVRSFKTQVYELGKNPHYWQPGRPHLDAVRVPAFAGNEQASLAMIRGDIDWGAIFIPAIERLFRAKDPEHRGYAFQQVEGTVMLYANTTRPPLDDAEVRKALSLGIDRARIVKIAMQGYTRPADASGLSDFYRRFHEPALVAAEGDWTRFDPRAGERLLDERGIRRGADGLRRLPDGSLFQVDINCVVGWSDWIIAAQLVVEGLQQMGVSAKLRTYDFGAWFSQLQRGEFQLSLGWSSGGPSLYTFYGRQMSSASVRPIGQAAEYNWQRFASPEADRLLAELAKTADAAEEQRLSRELVKVFVRSAPAIPLFPGPAFGQYNSRRIEGFPTAEDPYVALAPYKIPGFLLALVELRPKGMPRRPDALGIFSPETRAEQASSQQVQQAASPHPEPAASESAGAPHVERAP